MTGSHNPFHGHTCLKTSLETPLLQVFIASQWWQAFNMQTFEKHI